LGGHLAVGDRFLWARLSFGWVKIAEAERDDDGD
jgi:hypothetical protein